MIPALTPMLSALGPVALLLVMAVVFAETGLLVGFFLPGDSLLFTAGVLTATSVISLPLWVMALGVFVAAAAGDQLGYRIGRRLGPRLFTRQDSRLFARDHAARAGLLVERYGAKAVVLSRFIPVARTFTPVVAGVGRMTPSRFTAYNLAGALAWGVGVLLAGFYLGGVAFVAAHVELIILSLVAVSLVPATAAFASHRRSRPDPQSDEAVLVRPSMHAGV